MGGPALLGTWSRLSVPGFCLGCTFLLAAALLVVSQEGARTLASRGRVLPTAQDLHLTVPGWVSQDMCRGKPYQLLPHERNSSAPGRCGMPRVGCAP